MKSNGNNGKIQQIEEFRLYLQRCKDKKNAAESPWFGDETYWKFVADDLFSEANKAYESEKFLEAAQKYHQSAHIYSVLGNIDLAKKSHNHLISKSLDKITI